MAISATPVNQAIGSHTGTGSFNITVTAPTNGNLLVCAVDCASTGVDVTSITQTGATWVKAVGSSTLRSCSIWYAENVSGAGTTVTVNHSGTAPGSGIHGNCSEWSGVATSSSLDATGFGSNSANSTAIATATVTPTGSGRNALFITAVRFGGVYSSGPDVGTLLTSPDASSRAFPSYYVVASLSGSYTVNYVEGTAQNYETEIACFLAPSTAASWGPDLSDQLNRIVVAHP